MNMTMFMDIYDSMGDDGLTFDQVGARIAKRFEESIATNPYFYSGPYTGMIGRNAGYAFASRLLSNHSAEHPLGLMSTYPTAISKYFTEEDRLTPKQPRMC